MNRRARCVPNEPSDVDSRLILKGLGSSGPSRKHLYYGDHASRVRAVLDLRLCGITILIPESCR